MDEEAFKIIESCPKLKQDRSEWEASIAAFRERHVMSAESFCNFFAKRVAVEFFRGEISYSQGGLAMNQITVAYESDFPHHKFAGEIYQAFDAGEYKRAEDSDDTVPWQKYTLPLIKQALANEHVEKA